MSFFSLFKKNPSVITFSFDDRKLRFVKVSRTGKGISVDRYGTELFNEMIIDHHGIIKDDAVFVKKLQNIKNLLWKNNNPVEAMIVIPDSQATCFHSHVPKAPAGEMGDVIMSHITTYCKAHQLLDIKDYVCEYDIIHETDHGYDIHVTLAPQQFINHLMRLFKQAGIVVSHIETAHHAVARSCLSIPQGQGYIAVLVGEDVTHASLVHKDHLVSHKVIPVGTRELLKRVTKYLRISESDASQILVRHGIAKTHPDRILLGELYQAMMPIIYGINELLIDHGTRPYKNLGDRFSVETIVVYGQGGIVAGMVPWLGQELGIHAEYLNVWAGRTDHEPAFLQIPIEQTYAYAEALALALAYV